jgi:hypothetical protein
MLQFEETEIIIIIIIYLLQLGFHPVAVVLTLVHTIQMFSPGGSSPYTSTHNTNVFTRWQ